VAAFKFRRRPPPPALRRASVGTGPGRDEGEQSAYARGPSPPPAAWAKRRIEGPPRRWRHMPVTVTVYTPGPDPPAGGNLHARAALATVTGTATARRPAGSGAVIAFIQVGPP
jgi:hypothetical protein